MLSVLAFQDFPKELMDCLSVALLIWGFTQTMGLLFPAVPASYSIIGYYIEK